LLREWKKKREVFAGGLIFLFGLVAIVEGRRLGVGSLKAMGPGYVPMALGILLSVLGVLIAVAKPALPTFDQDEAPLTAEWRGWGCILLGVISFIVLGKYTGLVPGAFSCVFISALGDRTATIKSALVLSAAVTVFGILLFYYLLRIPIPLFSWGVT